MTSYELKLLFYLIRSLENFDKLMRTLLKTNNVCITLKYKLNYTTCSVYKVKIIKPDVVGHNTQVFEIGNNRHLLNLFTWKRVCLKIIHAIFENLRINHFLNCWIWNLNIFGLNFKLWWKLVVNLAYFSFV